jgi:squalene synthase HpnC
MEAAAVMARAAGENFPVASRALPRRRRAHLLALYGFARLVDEIGDSRPVNADGRAVGADLEAAGMGAGAIGASERLGALDELERELDRAYEGRATQPLLVALEPTLRACSLPRAPFARLIEANRVDQRVRSYETWEQLRGYCELSANPVGELVLGVFGAATPGRVRRSDAICTALQLAEHCQDVAEDLRRGRVYLPAEDLARFGCSAEDLHAEQASPGLAAVLAFEVGRARSLLVRGAGLIRELEGVRERLAVAAFVAGGRAALEAIERARFDVLAGTPRAGKRLRLRALAATLAGPRA